MFLLKLFKKSSIVDNNCSNYPIKPKMFRLCGADTTLVENPARISEGSWHVPVYVGSYRIKQKILQKSLGSGAESYKIRQDPTKSRILQDSLQDPKKSCKIM